MEELESELSQKDNQSEIQTLHPIGVEKEEKNKFLKFSLISLGIVLFLSLVIGITFLKFRPEKLNFFSQKSPPFIQLSTPTLTPSPTPAPIPPRYVRRTGF